MHGGLRRLVSFFVSLGLLVTGTPVAWAQGASYEEAKVRLDAAFAEIAQLRELIDRTTFDIEELGFELFFEDAEGITDWVAANIAFQPYAGILRGAEGTLRAGAGNAFDQSFLLANLLNQSGYESRIALGTLDDTQAAELVATTAPAPRRDYTELRERLEDALPGMGWELFFDSEADATRLDETNRFAGALISALGTEGLSLAGSAEDMIADARDYAWVEYRLSEADPWTEAHPAAPFLADAGLEAHERLEDEITAEYLHHVSFQVLNEAFNGEELEVKPVMAPWERPAANAAGVLITYSNVPNTADADLDIPTILADSEYWVPTFMDGMPASGQAFDMEGAMLDPEDAASPMAGVFRTVRGGFMDAVSALSGMGGGEQVDEPLALTAQWIVVTLTAPDGSEKEFRRTVFDRIGDEARAAGSTELTAMTRQEAELRLLSEHRLMLFSGDLPLDYLLDVYFERLLATKPLLERALALEYGVEPEYTVEEVVDSHSELEHLLTMAEFSQGPAGELSWLAEPALLMFSDGLAGTIDDTVVVSSLDIMNNKRRSSAGPELLLRHGVWETLSERDLFGDTQNNTANHGTDFRVVHAGAEAPADLASQARHNLQRDLDNGFAALIPDGSDTWWRVDLATGETLGITADGRGQSMLEYTIMLYDNAFSLMFAVKSFNDCTTASSWEAEVCCLAKAHLNAVFGLGLGHAIGGFGFGGAVLGMAALSFNVTSGVLGTDLTNFVPGGVC